MQRKRNVSQVLWAALLLGGASLAAEDPPSPGGFHLRSEATAGQVGGQAFPKPYSPPCTERENVFEFTEKPKVKDLGNDKYEITFAVKGNCDVTVGVVDSAGKVVRHLAAGVLGANAPAPFQKNSLKQTIYWSGKDDLDVYHKEPGKLRVRVMLGLKPEFDKRLGGTSPHNLPGNIFGMVTDGTGMYVISIGGRRKMYFRKFDFEGKYLYSFGEPPAAMPEEKLAGRGYVEYEPGRRALHAPEINQTVSDHGRYLAQVGKAAGNIQPAIVGGKLFYLTDGKYAPSAIHNVHTDGSSDLQGMKGRPFLPGAIHTNPRFAASPDGQWLYMAGCGQGSGAYASDPFILRMAVEGTGPAAVFLGDRRSPGSDNAHFNSPAGIACDPQGRIYVCDMANSRLQIFSSEGKHLKTVPIERPSFVCVHEKTGAIYVQHVARVEGKSVSRVVKLVSFEQPDVVAQVDGPFGLMVLDAWSAKPRLWFSGGEAFPWSSDQSTTGNHVVTVWEEDGKTFKRIMDFEELAKKEDGAAYAGRWGGSALGAKVACDGLRERVYFGNHRLYDLATGANLGTFKFNGGSFDDIALDKRGYMHVHFNPGFYMPGVGRLDPSRSAPPAADKESFYPEIPYDYGVEAEKERQSWLGILPARDQPGPKFFQDGIGVNMRGDVAENCNIYYVPRMDDYATLMAHDGRLPDVGCDNRVGKIAGGYATMLRQIHDQEKRGEAVYSIRRQPGVPLSGGTIWTFDSNGELRDECGITAGKLVNGVQIDEDGKIYFTNGRICLRGERPFLAGQGGTFGVPAEKGKAYIFTGTFMKTRCKNMRALLKGAPVPLEEAPARPPELAAGYGEQGPVWVEGAEWLYAGASPIVCVTCSCPTHRAHLDWYKRSFVPEAYRHSIGILDTNGNLVMHLGRYGNHDDALAMKPGTTDIPQTLVRFVSGTDNYLCFEDNGERLVVLKLNYHAEESASIEMK